MKKDFLKGIFAGIIMMMLITGNAFATQVQETIQEELSVDNEKSCVYLEQYVNRKNSMSLDRTVKNLY